MKIPKRALRIKVRFSTLWGRLEWIILAVWIAHFFYFYFVKNLWRKSMAYVRLQLNSLSPQTRQYIFSWTTPPPLTKHTYFKDDSLLISLMTKILCVELFQATFTHQRSQYTSNIKLETLLSSLLRKKTLWKFFGRRLWVEHLIYRE